MYIRFFLTLVGQGYFWVVDAFDKVVYFRNVFAIALWV